jgi:hypothetical protein
MCWKGAEVSSVATLYASHASEVRRRIRRLTPAARRLDCATPLPVSATRNTGERLPEGDRQRRHHTSSRSRRRSEVRLLGHDQVFCEADPVVQAALVKAGLGAPLIQSKCSSRDPVVDPPFCCSTGPANAAPPQPAEAPARTSPAAPSGRQDLQCQEHLRPGSRPESAHHVVEHVPGNDTALARSTASTS